MFDLNHFIYRAKYRYAKYLPLKVPVDISLELSSKCNMACQYCYHHDPAKLPFTKGFMSYELAEKIITEAAALGVHSLKFNYRGESTLHPDFFNLTALAKMYANGSTFIDRITNSNFKFKTEREDIFLGLCNQTKVKVSFDSFVPEVMETQRAGSIHALAMKNIDYFYHHPKRKDTEIVIQAVRTKLNKDEDLKGQIERRWPGAIPSIRDMVGGRVNKDLSSLEHKTRDASERQSCIQAHARLVIHWDGRVSPCCPSIKNDLLVGDLNKQTISEVWNSETSKKLRQDLLSKKAFDSDPCKNCSSFETFKGYKHPWMS